MKVRNIYPFLSFPTFLILGGQSPSATYSIDADSYAPLAGKAVSQSYSNFSAVEPCGGLSVKSLPNFKNMAGFIGQIKMAPLDQDGDGLSDQIELSMGTNINKADSDGDGLTDFEENPVGTDPLKSDTDGDGFQTGGKLVRIQIPKSRYSYC